MPAFKLRPAAPGRPHTWGFAGHLHAPGARSPDQAYRDSTLPTDEDIRDAARIAERVLVGIARLRAQGREI